MIATDRLLWFHLPKTGGTTTDSLFVRSGLPLLWRDPQDSSDKHLPAKEHPQSCRFVHSECVRVINFRRLPSWLLSNHHHKLGSMGLSLGSTPMRQGLFYRQRLDSWLPADWWLDRFEINDQWQFLRVESLKLDFDRLLARYQPINAFRRISIALAPSRNQRFYDRQLSSWFTPAEVQTIYQANPRWADLEIRLYGGLLA